MIGRDECLSPLKKYLFEETLCDPAAATISSISTPQSKQILLEVLNSANTKCLKAIIPAIAKLQIIEAEPKLLRLLGGNDINIEKELLYALSRCGSDLSLNILFNAAEKDEFTMNMSGGNEAYIALLHRLLLLGEQKKVEKATYKLLNKATNLNKIQTRIAALDILLTIKKKGGLNLVLTALKDPNPEYRNAALHFSSDFVNRDIYEKIISQLSHADENTKIDIVYWLGVQKEKMAVIQIQNLLNSQNLNLSKAAALALLKIGDENSIPVITKLLSSTNSEFVALGKRTLLSFKGDISTELVKSISNFSEAGQIAAMELLAARKSHQNLNTVLEQLNTTNIVIRTAAYNALPAMISLENFDMLCNMLENSNDSIGTVKLQQAIINAIANQSVEDMQSRILSKFNSADTTKKYLYYVVLASVNSQNVLNLIVDEFNKTNGIAKDAAFNALTMYKDIAVAEKLFTICKNDASTVYFDKAFTTSVKMVGSSNMKGETKMIFLGKAMDIAKTKEQKIEVLKQVEKTNTFLALIYAGKFIEDLDLQQTSANTIMNIALKNKSYTSSEVKKLLNRVIEVLNNPDADYQRQAIKLHLSGMPIIQEVVVTKLSDTERKEGYELLFDGKNLDEWLGNKQDYIAENGCISVYPSQSFGGNLYTKKEYENFIFRFEFQLTPAANNGVGIRTPLDGDAAYVGMEIQVLDDDAPVYKDLNAYQYHGSVYGVIPSKRGFLKPLGEWNYEEIYAHGNHIKVILNGIVILDGDIKEAAKNGTVDHNPHPGLFNKKGHLGFLGHGSPVKFRSIRIKEID
jgi:HEAT repeat protein